MDVKKIKGLCCEGGGVLGCGHVGALEVLSSEGILDGITHFSGSSAGSIISASLACKIPLDIIKEELLKVDFNSFKDDSFGYILDIVRLCSEFGWYKGDALETWFGDMLQKHVGSSEITLKEVFEKYGTFLIITTVDVNKGKCVYMSWKTHPDLKLKKAVRRSSGIPVFFKADHEKDIKGIIHYFIDGGTLDNYPINSLNDELDPSQVIGIKLISTLELYEIDNIHIPIDDLPPDNFVHFVRILIAMLHNQALKVHIKEGDWKRTIKVDVKNISSTNFAICDKEKMFLIEQGKNASIDFLKLFETNYFENVNF